MSPFLFLIDDSPSFRHQNDDDHFFALALKSARKGLGKTWPNPAVGCVVVNQGMVLAQARTQDSGRPHAESTALKSAGSGASSATMYVTLEPCCHIGATGPCTDAITSAGVKRLIYGVEDPDPRVCGKGLAALRAKQLIVEQIQNISLQKQSQSHIAAYTHAKSTGRPYVVAKLALSHDGMISARPGIQTQITGAETQRLVHGLRSHVDAVMVGANTAIIDDPQLNVRLGATHGEPWKIVVDSQLRTDPHARVYSGKAMVIHCDSAPQERQNMFDRLSIKRLETPCFQGMVDLEHALLALGAWGLTSLLLEGGAKLVDSFRIHNFIDEFWLFNAPTETGLTGVPAWSKRLGPPAFSAGPLSFQVGSDTLIVAKAQKDNSCG